MRIFKFLLVFILFLVLVCVASFIPVPVYDFQQGKPFAGDYIYNPYDGIDSVSWRKANFHAHQREKPACDYTVDQFVEAYRLSGYDIIGLTDHNYINLERSERQGFIPGYEHGYGINRHHHCVLGAEETWKFDFPVMLTQSQAQFIVNKLRPQGAALVLNHPGELRIVDHNLYTRLRGYDFIELNPERKPGIASPDIWDQALSVGIYSSLIADDDAHTITDRNRWFQRSFTMVNTPTYAPSDIIGSLKKGRAYGVYIPNELNMSSDHHPAFPHVTGISFRGDTISVAVSEPAASVRFIGQGGATLAQFDGGDKGISGADYLFSHDDTFVRTEITFPDGIIFFLNPFVRTPDGAMPQNDFNGSVNYPLTILSALGWAAAAVFLVICIVKLVRSPKKQRRNRKYSHLYKDVRPF